jgi:pimeloyl-ACP methyl ester carboxylesterase
VLCVHGIPGSWRQAVPLAEDLADRFEVILPSRPGYGRTPIRVGRTYEEQADSFAALLDACGIDRCSVVGISGGGPPAAAFAVRHPDRTDALVLACALSPHLVTPPRSWLLFRVPGLAEVLMPPLRAINRRRARKPANVDVVLTKSLTADEYARMQADPRIKSDLLRHVLSHQEAPPSVAGLRNDYAQVSRRIASVPEASQVQCRALVLHGDADPVVTMAHARFHAQVLGAPLKVFDDAGHLFLLTRRAEASEAIRSFVSSL